MAPTMKRTIGRIVRFHAGDGIDRPAIITHVWETSVNLVVFNDGSHEPEAPAAVYATSVIEGSEIGQWSWPPREGYNFAKAKEVDDG